MTTDHNVEEPCEVTSLTHGFGAERRGRPLRLGNPLMELLGRRECTHEALKYYERLCELLTEDEREPDALTQDVAQFLKNKQLHRESKPAISSHPHTSVKQTPMHFNMFEKAIFPISLSHFPFLYKGKHLCRSLHPILKRGSQSLQS